MKKILVFVTLLALILPACTPAATPQATSIPALEATKISVLAESQVPTLAATQAPTLAPGSGSKKPLQPLTPKIPPTPLSGGGYPPAVSAARKDLAQQLNLQTGNLIPTSIIPRDWPDGCLGTGGSDEMCTQVITPGYEITFVVGAAQYVYHTDLEGKNIRRVGKPVPAISGEVTRTVLKWENAACDAFSVSTQAVFVGKCGGDMLVVPGKESLVTQVLAWALEFAPFVSETPVGKVEFSGFGKMVATSAQQRHLAEWATMRYAEIESGRSGAAWGLAWAYTRSGGFAGFCDSIGVYRDGLVKAENCKGTKTTFYLTASQLEPLYGWLDGLQRFDYKAGDPAVTDAMTITLTFEGQGSQTADEATARQIVEFTADLMAQAAFQPGADLPQAGKTLKDFFTALNSGDYAGAAKLYGGDTSQLQAWNPDIKDDLPKWLERACTQNGLQCLLPRSVTLHGPDARGGYQFFIEFNNADGTLFRSDNGGAPVSAFLFAVVKVGANWQVMDLPPYVP